jgi:putative flippase GtrA
VEQMSATVAERPSFVQKTKTMIRQKGPRYVGVSVINVIVGQGLLVFFHVVLHIGQTLSNVLAVSISAVPAYYLSRAWVWGRKGKSHFKTEVLPFWLFIAVGLVFSTIMVAVGSRIAGVTGEDVANLSAIQKLLPNLLNMFAFGILWVLRFFLMEKLFTRRPELAEELVGEDFIEAKKGAEAVRQAEEAEARRRAANGG